MINIPNLITLLNLSSGFIAIIFASRGEVVTASWLILAAMVFDFLDGLAARQLKAYSDIGRELDSLADLVSFGVAPAFIIYKLLEYALSIPGQPNGLLTIRNILVFSPVIMPVCAALRLAVFNLDTTQKTSFRGLPTPANAIAVISLVLASPANNIPFINWLTNSPSALIVYTILLSVLMITRLPLLSLKFTSLSLRGNEPRYILIILVLVSVLVMGQAGILFIIPVYILVSLVSGLVFRK